MWVAIVVPLMQITHSDNDRTLSSYMSPLTTPPTWRMSISGGMAVEIEVKVVLVWYS
jgi:hypothetical protein